MNVNECLKILREIKDVAFASVDKYGKPQIRIIDIMLVEEEKIYFCTARGKDFYEQLIRDGNVAITGMNKKYQMIRVNGKAEKLNGQSKWIDRIFEHNPSMNDVYPGDSRYILEAFEIRKASLEFFDLGVKPINRESFVIGEELMKEVGFVINENCIKCNTCYCVCPQQCISKDTPYKINQEHCLHCGLCFESCPVKAIEKR